MKTKIIPFGLKTAKKIQEGEIEGKIITKNKIPCRIVAYCNSGDIPNSYYCVFTCDYVHELQHTLKTFKIEKEIVL